MMFPLLNPPQIDGNTAVVTGIVPERMFVEDSEPLDNLKIVILGIAVVQKKREDSKAEIGFIVRFDLESPTLSPTGTPLT